MSSPCSDCVGKVITPQEAEKGYKDGICDVCRLWKKDETMKQIKHCNFCNADICIACETKYGWRLASAILEKFNWIIK